MIIDFQMQVAAFVTAQKAALQAMKLCPPAPIPIGPVQVVIDRFEFGANSLRHNQATIKQKVLRNTLRKFLPALGKQGRNMRVR